MTVINSSQLISPVFSLSLNLPKGSKSSLFTKRNSFVSIKPQEFLLNTKQLKIDRGSKATDSNQPICIPGQVINTS